VKEDEKFATMLICFFTGSREAFGKVTIYWIYPLWWYWKGNEENED